MLFVYFIFLCIVFAWNIYTILYYVREIYLKVLSYFILFSYSFLFPVIIVFQNLYFVVGRRGSVASSEVCSSGVASSNCYYELFSGTTTGIQLILAGCRKLFPLTFGWASGRKLFFIFSRWDRWAYIISKNLFWEMIAPYRTSTIIIYFFYFIFFILHFIFLFFILWIHFDQICCSPDNMPFPAPGVPPPPNPGWGGLKWSRDPPDFSYANSA